MQEIATPEFKLSGRFVADSFAVAAGIRRISDRLGRLASAAEVLGNESLAETLFSNSDELKALSKAVSDICSAETCAGLHAAQAGTATMLNALAGGMRLVSDTAETKAAATALESLATKQA